MSNTTCPDPEKTGVKDLLVKLKKSYSQTAAALQEKEKQLQELLQASASHAELAEENQALIQQVFALKEHIHALKNKNMVPSSVQELELALQSEKEQTSRDKLRIEKLSGLLFEKDQRLSELRHIETNFKKATENKQELENRLQQEQEKVQKLEQLKLELEAQVKEVAFEAKQLRENVELMEMLSQESIQQRDAERKENQEELELLFGQIDGLKNKVQTLQHELAASISEKGAVLKTNDLLQTELLKKEQQIKDKQHLFEACEKECALIKQTLVRGLREAKELEGKYLATVQEKVAALARFSQSQHQIDRQQEEIELLRNQLKTSAEAIEEAHQQTRNTKSELMREMQQQEDLHRVIEAKDVEAEALNGRISSLEEECRLAQEDIQHVYDLVQQKEEELNQAQQHFAKKLKETALLEDRCEEQQMIIQEHQDVVQQYKASIAELQASLELYEQQQVQLQGQLQDSVKSAESQLVKWEQKYFDIYEKWQAAETRIHELEKIEEKQKHVQGLLANLGSFIGFPNADPGEPLKLKIKETSAEEGTAHKPPAESGAIQQTKPYQSLFNMPKSPNRPRQNFFE